MRIVLDLQAAQCHTMSTGTGRYCLAFAKAIARTSNSHEILLALSGRFPDTVRCLKAEFSTLIPRDNIRVFELPGPLASSDPANAWRSQTAECLRENFLADLRPDIVHLSTIFEGWQNDVVASLGRSDDQPPTVVSLFDSGILDRIKSSQPDLAQFYQRRSRLIKDADLVFTVSRSAREKVMATFGLSADRVVHIPPGIDLRSPKVSVELSAQILQSPSLNRPFLLFAWDEAESEISEKCVAAFALLPPGLRRAHQLAFAGEIAGEERAGILSVCLKHGLSEKEVVIVPSLETGRLLYGRAALVVFPSANDGIGLSVLDAMAVGAPVIGSNRGMVGEIIEHNDALFDPTDPADIAAHTVDVLTQPALHGSLRDWGAQRTEIFSWKTQAGKALDALQEVHARRRPKRITASKRKPLLALVAPFPPEQTGIAKYSARLAPSLEEYYDIVCITDQPRIEDPLVSARFPVRNTRWFEQHGGRFERVLYQFGNSAFHKQMFGLLEQHTGVVVLHDFFLSDVLCGMSESGCDPGCFSRALYDSHGLSALVTDNREARLNSARAFPCNIAVLRDSAGVLVHSTHAINLARSWYGASASAFMRRVPFLAPKPEPRDRASARERLQLPANSFVVCSFGWVTPFKLCDRILKSWSTSPLLGKSEDCFLIFVGATCDGPYGRDFAAQVAASEGASRIRITGYVNEEQYHDYLAAADLAIQLRTQSRGETSATIFDCLALDLPLVVNAHGSAAELPDDVVIKISDDFTDEALTGAITSLRTNPELGRKYSSRAAAYLDAEHRPELIAKKYRDFIEEVNITSPRAREQRLLKKIAGTLAPVPPSPADLANVAIALSANRQPFGLRQILIDITNITKLDLRTGIERVARAILMSLISKPPSGYRIEPVRAFADGYVYARRFIAESLDFPRNELDDDPVETKHGDIFLGIDWPADVLPSLKPWFGEQSRHGMRTTFVVHDLLPLLRPDLFPPELPPLMLGWLNTVTEIADGVVCVSRTVADELHRWLVETKPNRSEPLPIGFFPLGADLRASLPTTGLPDEASTILARLDHRPTFLMVGTVEPRKGHRQALTAMELLWREQVDINLAIIGKKGWMMDDFAERILQHPEKDKRLFWYQGISDEMLEEIYRRARALLAASEGEGFGLPLIEAAQYGIPILARDIPIFREVASDHAYYFRGRDEVALSNAIRDWLALGDAVPSSAGLRWYTWQESSRELLDIVLRERWYRSWPAVG
jgi:glycosyltransferase involved in cell wall biosynthesis